MRAGYSPDMQALLANGGRLLVIEILAEMPYAEYLLTGHWAEIRKRTLRLAGWRCQVCLAEVALDVHHISYANRGCEPPEDVIALCQDRGEIRGCHRLQHEALRAAMRAQKKLVVNC